MSPKESQELFVAILLIILFAGLFGWPLAITAISMPMRLLIAVPWWAILITFFVFAHNQGKRKRTGTATASAAVSSTLPATSLAPAAQAPAVISRPAPNAPKLTPDQVARAHEKAARAIREQRARGAGSTSAATIASTPAKPAAQTSAARQTKVELTDAEKRDIEARYDELMARQKAIREHLAEYRKQQGEEKG